MNYTIDDNIIHDDEAMWHLALEFKVRYNFIKEQVERSLTQHSILYKGNIIMQRDEQYKTILSDYKSELKFINHLLEYILLNYKDKKIEKYINADL